MIKSDAFLEAPMIVKIQRVDKKKDGAWYLRVRDYNRIEYSVRTRSAIKRSDKGRYAEVDFGQRGIRFIRLIHKNNVPEHAL